MSVDGVNKVAQDGRLKFPPELAEKYRGEYVSFSELTDGRIALEVVDQDE